MNRTFAFADICGFTTYLEGEGEQAAVRLLSSFRATAREVAARRGVRIAKWLGDGVMLVSVETPPLVATVVELTGRLDSTGLDLRAGIAGGSCLLFEADDYVGHAVNLAARLCDRADPGQVLADEVTSGAAPAWVRTGRPSTYRLPGVGRVRGVRDLALQERIPLTA